MNHTHGDAAHCRVVCLLLVYVLVCLRYLLNLRSHSDLWFSSVCGVHACMRGWACVCVLWRCNFLHLSVQPARPTLCAKSAFYCPFGLQ